MEANYVSELHTQILIALLKEHGIKNIIASPGGTNVCFIGSVQQDSYFTLYSSVDERSAAFIACGMAAESGEPVALVCTGSTASRNYIPGLTEAYYRHLPVLAITTSQHLGRTGNMYPQFVDRSRQLNDMVKISVLCQPVHDDEDKWACELAINKALLALRSNGGGPAHINLITTYSRLFNAKSLPDVKVIKMIENLDDMPDISNYHRIAILVGCHGKWSSELSEAVESFCQKYDAVVLNHHASNYKGNYGVNFALLQFMQSFTNPLEDADLVITFGQISRYKSGMKNSKMWRISEDGQIADSERRLTKVFKMREIDFFNYYNNIDSSDRIENPADESYAVLWQKLYKEAIQNISELPLSNVWVAQNTISKIPDGSVMHMAGSNTARSWNYFELPKSIECYSNDGTMGIDGQLSALIGESLAAPDRLHFGVIGDLTLFYDLNSLGNRHVGKNIRLMVINNGVGAEFKIYTHAAMDFGDDGTPYMAAGGHYGNKSHRLLHHYAEDLGYEYLSAETKEEYLEGLKRFLVPEITDKSMIFEVFTNASDESDAVYIMNHLLKTAQNAAIDTAKNTIKKLIGKKGVDAIRGLREK